MPWTEACDRFSGVRIAQAERRCFPGASIERSSGECNRFRQGNDRLHRKLWHAAQAFAAQSISQLRATFVTKWGLLAEPPSHPRSHHRSPSTRWMSSRTQFVTFVTRRDRSALRRLGKGASNMAIIVGTLGDDTLVGTDDADTISGLPGNDNTGIFSWRGRRDHPSRHIYSFLSSILFFHFIESVQSASRRLQSAGPGAPPDCPPRPPRLTNKTNRNPPPVTFTPTPRNFSSPQRRYTLKARQVRLGCILWIREWIADLVMMWRGLRLYSAYLIVIGSILSSRLAVAEEIIQFKMPVACEVGRSCYIQNYRR